uniref:CD247 antigen like n=1 Tax=Scatophagus argus TaxID=75038 RepID=UPI001ED8114E|nr:CD247 antigen like [Scatophagus argus]
MDILRMGVFVLFVLMLPVSCEDILFTEPITCYFLDGILIIYCLVVTACYFREKFSTRLEAVEVCIQQENSADIYQDLERPVDADPYQVLEPTKRKKKAGRKKRSQPTQALDRNTVPREPLNLRAPAPPLSPR